MYSRVHQAELLQRTSPKDWKDKCLPFSGSTRSHILTILTDGQDHLLDMHLATGSRLVRNRAVSRWLAFCYILSIDPIIRSIDDSISLRWFIYFLGAAWYNNQKSDQPDPRGLSSKYIGVLLSQVRQWHLDQGHSNPLEFDKITGKVLKGLQRITGDNYKPPLPVSQIAFAFIVSTLKSTNNIKNNVLAATIIIMFTFLLRISEVAQTSQKRKLKAAYLRQGDVTFPSTKTEPHVRIALRDTKSDANNLVIRSLPHKQTNDIYDIMKEISTNNISLAKSRGYTEQQLAEMPFININGVPLEREDISETIRSILSLPSAPKGLPDPSRYSTHSLRKGGATELLRMQIDIATIKYLGRWKSMAWLLYAQITNDCLDRAATVMANALSF